MEGFGAKLRATRIAWKLTLKEVEQRSLRLAEQWGNAGYGISASWLDRIEREDRGLSAPKLIALANIYSLSAEQMLALCPGITAGTEPASFPNNSVVAQGRLSADSELWLPESIFSETAPELTGLLRSTETPGRYIRGVVGLQDGTLDPMVRPGSHVLIDTHKRSIAARRDWNHEFDRPIYFMMTRTGYVCGFCELDSEGKWLTVVPHLLSYEKSRRWRYRKEIEVVGTVIAVTSRRAA